MATKVVDRAVPAAVKRTAKALGPAVSAKAISGMKGAPQRNPKAPVGSRENPAVKRVAGVTEAGTRIFKKMTADLPKIRPGRKPAGEPGTVTRSHPVTVSAKVTAAQHEKFIALGASSWLREAIDGAPKPRGFKPSK